MTRRTSGPPATAAVEAHLEVDIVQECAAWEGCPGLESPGLETMIMDAARRAYVAATAGSPRSARRGGTPAASVTIALLSDADVRSLNRQFRGKDTPTNVLSFPATANPPDGDDGAPSLGDLALAFETIAAEALEARIPVLHHIGHLVIHGVLHLLGHDHEIDADAEIMESLETRILAGMGIADPYAA